MIIEVSKKNILLYKYFTNGVISYKSVNKLSHIFDYEKMIGGYVINSPKNVRCIDISECHKIYQKWFLKFTLANLKTHPQYDINEHGECADLIGLSYIYCQHCIIKYQIVKL